jgi:hypothetical protein
VDTFARIVEINDEFPDLVGGVAAIGTPKHTELDDAFFPALRAWGAANKVDPEWLLLVLYLESTLHPDVGNSLGYVGLNQLNSSYLRSAFHTEPADYLTWSASEQMIHVVGPWLKRALRGVVPQSIGHLYAFNIAPSIAYAHGAPETVIFSSPTKEYQKNSGLDYDKSGSITIGDFNKFFERLATRADYKKALARLRASTSLSIPAKPWTVPAAAAIAIVGAGLGLGIFFAVRS